MKINRVPKQVVAKIILSWTILTALGALISLFLLDAVTTVVILGNAPDIALAGDNAIFPLLFFGIGLVLLPGSCVGWGQGFILRYLLGETTIWWKWALTTGLSGLVTLPISIILALIGCGGTTTIIPIWTALQGFTLGFMQYLLIRKSFSMAAGWIPATGIAWLAAVGVGYFVRTAFLPAIDSRYLLPFYPPAEAFYWGVSWTTGALVFGVMTALALLGLLQGSNVREVPQTA